MSLDSSYYPPPTTVECDNPKCNALYEVPNFLGGHTFTCNRCGSRVTIRDVSIGIRPAKALPSYRSRRKSWGALLLLGAVALICFFAYLAKIGAFSKAADHNPSPSPGSHVEAPSNGTVGHPEGLIRTFANGTHLTKDLATAGYGQLTVINGTSKDACVALVDVSRSIRVSMIYVRANNSAELKHLNAGGYRILFTIGSDWDNRAGRFSQDAEYLDFGKVLTFAETRDSGTIRFSKQTITLNETLDGNALSNEIPESEFRAISGH